MYAMRKDVGVVGAKLYYPDKTIQHAGIVIGLGAHRTAGHTHYRISFHCRSTVFYENRAQWIGKYEKSGERYHGTADVP